MADVGLIVRNTNTVVQIDGNFNNLAFRAKGFAADGGQATGTGMRFLRVTTGSSANAIIAIKATGYNFLASVVTNGPDSKTYTWIADVRATIEWFVFDEIEYCPRRTEPYGMVVRNKNTGKVVFDSRYRYMRVQTVTQLNTYPPQWPNVQQIGYPVANIGFVQGVTAWSLAAAPEFDPVDPGQIAWTSIYDRACIYSSGATAYFQLVNIDNAYYPPGTGMPTTGSYEYTTFLILDMTGL